MTFETQSAVEISIKGEWSQLLKPGSSLCNAVARYIPGKRWFRGKSLTIKDVVFNDVVYLSSEDSRTVYTVICVSYIKGENEEYFLPLTLVPETVEGTFSSSFIVARINSDHDSSCGYLVEAIADKLFAKSILSLMCENRKIKSNTGELIFSSSCQVKKEAEHSDLQASLLTVEQSNNSISFGNQFILKLLRKLEPGLNPELEMGEFLTRQNFQHAGKVHASIAYQNKEKESVTAGILMDYIPNQGDAWQYTLDSVKQYFERILSLFSETRDYHSSELEGINSSNEPAVNKLIGPYWETARALGQRTAELHVALSKDSKNPDFSPVKASAVLQKARYQSMHTLVTEVFHALAENVSTVSDDLSEACLFLLSQKLKILELLKAIHTQETTAKLIRCHGDLHLGQILFTGKDFMFIDFEGEPARSIPERRMKKLALTDVAGMLRSFSYAAYSALASYRTSCQENVKEKLDPWAQVWIKHVSLSFVTSYIETAENNCFIPLSRDEFNMLLDILLVEKAVYELGYELNNRPDWLFIPLRGIMDVMGEKLA